MKKVEKIKSLLTTITVDITVRNELEKIKRENNLASINEAIQSLLRD